MRRLLLSTVITGLTLLGTQRTADACSIAIVPGVLSHPAEGEVVGATVPELVLEVTPFEGTIDDFTFAPANGSSEKPSFVLERNPTTSHHHVKLARPLLPDTEYVLSGTVNASAAPQPQPSGRFTRRFRTGAAGSGRLADDATLGAVQTSTKAGNLALPSGEVELTVARPEGLAELGPVVRYIVQVEGVGATSYKTFEGSFGGPMPRAQLGCMGGWGRACQTLEPTKPGTYRISVKAEVGASRTISTSAPLEVVVSCDDQRETTVLTAAEAKAKAAHADRDAADGCAIGPRARGGAALAFAPLGLALLAVRLRRRR